MLPQKIERRLRAVCIDTSQIADEVEAVHNILDEFGIPRTVGRDVTIGADARLKMLLDMECNLHDLRTS